MKLVPLLRCPDMAAALRFYTEVLDFVPAGPADNAGAAWVTLRNGEAFLHLSLHDGLAGTPVQVWVDEVDELFAFYRSRGLDPSGKAGSPVHQGPTDQSWGTREFYADDPAGNTLRFCTVIR